MTDGAWADRWDRVMVPAYATPEVFVAEGSGCTVRDVDGRTYLDLLAGLAVASTGHAHPRITEALADQAGRSIHHSNLYGIPAAVRLAERLTDRVGLGKVFYCNSGSEATDLALKVVRRHLHEEGLSGDVVAFEDGFHGRTLGALTLTGQPEYHRGFGPLVPGIDHLPFDDVEALKAAFEDDPPGAVVYEPVQGEGGIVPMAPGFAETLGDLADDHGTLLVADEVQTGIHRTGPFLASWDLDLEPDVVTLAKGLASGVPIGAVLVRDELAADLGPGDHGCTFGGGPLAAEAALATLDVVASEDLGARAGKMGAMLQDGLAETLGESVATVRGRGLLVGAVLEDLDAGGLREAARGQGVLVGSIGDDVLRVSPPLVVTADEIATGLERIGRAAATL